MSEGCFFLSAPLEQRNISCSQVKMRLKEGSLGDFAQHFCSLLGAEEITEEEIVLPSALSEIRSVDIGKEIERMTKETFFCGDYQMYLGHKREIIIFQRNKIR